MSSNYFVLGEPYDKAAKNRVFLLDIYKHVDFIRAADFGETEELDPRQYFVTSGDAVQKSLYMLKQFDALSNKKLSKKYKTAIKNNIKKINRLIELLIEARGSDCFLETEWENHLLKCVPKNPRR